MSTPIQIEKELQELAADIDHWDRMLAWHEAQRDWFKTKLTIAEARAVMEYTGAATKAKWYGITQSEPERIALDVANAQLLVCERRIHSLEKTLLTVMGRNKSASNSYQLGY